MPLNPAKKQMQHPVAGLLNFDPNTVKAKKRPGKLKNFRRRPSAAARLWIFPISRHFYANRRIDHMMR